MMFTRPYEERLYEAWRNAACQSARAVIPIVLQLVHATTVVDVGCGDGTWLSVFREFGVNDVLGVDGEHVDPHILQIPSHQFRAVDLTKPLRIERSFDLAVSLEVAEHLPPHCAPQFVESLTRLAPVLLFSAAIPLQGGTHHLNEQWPDYWAALFKRHDFVPIDCIRRRIWEDDRVQWWYAQNALLFASAALIQNDAALHIEYERASPQILRLVHPRKYLEEGGLREASHRLAKALKRSVLWRFQRLQG